MKSQRISKLKLSYEKESYGLIIEEINSLFTIIDELINQNEDNIEIIPKTIDLDGKEYIVEELLTNCTIHKLNKLIDMPRGNETMADYLVRYSNLIKVKDIIYKKIVDNLICDCFDTRKNSYILNIVRSKIEIIIIYLRKYKSLPALSDFDITQLNLEKVNSIMDSIKIRMAFIEAMLKKDKLKR